MTGKLLHQGLKSFILSSLLLCSPPGFAECCQLPAGWQQLSTEETEGSDEKAVIKAAAIDLNKATISLGQPFSFALKLCPLGDHQIDRVTATAMMPAHLHGMNYTPEVTTNTGQADYLVAGFLFHMPGLWKITVSAYSGQQVSHFSTEVMLQ